MEKEFEKPEIDFYLVTSAGGEKYMATLGHKGGFIYYAFDSVTQGNISKIVVHVFGLSQSISNRHNKT